MGRKIPHFAVKVSISSSLFRPKMFQIQQICKLQSHQMTSLVGLKELELFAQHNNCAKTGPLSSTNSVMIVAFINALCMNVVMIAMHDNIIICP